MTSYVPQVEPLRGIVKLMGGHVLKGRRLICDDVWFDTGLVYPGLTTSAQRSARRLAAIRENISCSNTHLGEANEEQKQLSDKADLHANLPTAAHIIDAEQRFWQASEDDEVAAQYVFDVSQFIVVPGYVDIQINGGFGLDFSTVPVPLDADTVHRKRNPSGYRSEATTYPDPVKKPLPTVALQCHPQTKLMRQRSMTRATIQSPVIQAQPSNASTEHQHSDAAPSALLLDPFAECDAVQPVTKKNPRLRRVCLVDDEAIQASTLPPQPFGGNEGTLTVHWGSPFEQLSNANATEGSDAKREEVAISSTFGYDFTLTEAASYITEGDPDLTRFAQLLLMYGVTSFCPTVISSSEATYQLVIPRFLKYFSAVDVITRAGGVYLGARMVGLHLEGPFISVPGAHNRAVLTAPKNYAEVCKRYGVKDESSAPSSDEIKRGDTSRRSNPWKHVRVVTLAPELEGAKSVITELTKRGVVVSAGHSEATYAQAEEAIAAGTTLVTHMFNAMKSFHHRDPGLIGILAAGDDQPAPSESTDSGDCRPTTCAYSIIPDGIHAHPKSVRIAYASHPEGMIAVTDAMGALGLGEGEFKLGEMDVVISNNRATIRGTQTLAGAIVDMDTCVRNVRKFTQCTDAQAIRTATYAPARCLGMEDRIGTLKVGASADILLLDKTTLSVKAVIRGGQIVYSEGGIFPPVSSK